MGQLYLTNVDFLKNGVPASIVAATVIIICQYGNAHLRIEQVVATLGFALMRAIGYAWPSHKPLNPGN